MKRQIKEILFKIFRRQILRATYNLNPKNFVQIKEVRFDWVKVRSQVERPDPYLSSLRSALDLPYSYSNKEVEEKEIRWQLLQQLIKEIDKQVEVKKMTDPYTRREQYVIELYIANEPK